MRPQTSFAFLCKVRGIIAKHVGVAYSAAASAFGKLVTDGEWASLDAIIAFFAIVKDSTALTAKHFVPFSEGSWAQCFQWADAFVKGRAMVSGFKADEVEIMNVDTLIAHHGSMYDMLDFIDEDMVKVFGLPATDALLEHRKILLSSPQCKLLVQRLSSMCSEKYDAWFSMAGELGNWEGEQLAELSSREKALDAMVDQCGDLKLRVQVGFFRDSAGFAAACSKVTKEWADADRDGRGLSDKWVTLVEPVRRLQSAFHAQMTDEKYLKELFTPLGDDDRSCYLHMHFLDSRIDAVGVCKGCIDEARKVMEPIYEQWNADLSDVVAGVEAWCPAWQAKARDADLFSRDFLNVLFKNKSYSKISPACNFIKRMVDCITRIGSDGGGLIASPEVLLKATSTKKLGFDTVSLTYSAYQLFIEIPKLKEQAAIAKAIFDLRAALGGKSFSIPMAMQARMDEMCATKGTSGSAAADVA